MTKLFRCLDPDEKKPQQSPTVTTRLLETTDLDMDDREPDAYKLEPYVKMDFDELFHEPETMRENILDRTIGENVIRGCYANMFLYVKVSIFFVLSVVVGCVASICFAVLTAVTAVLQVWVVRPVIKILFTWLLLMRALVKALVGTFCEPCCHALGQTLGHISGRFRTEINDFHFRAPGGVAGASPPGVVKYGTVAEKDAEAAAVLRGD